MKHAILATAALLLLARSLLAQPSPLMEKKFPATFRVTHTLTLRNKGLDCSAAVNPRFTLALALPGTNDYQTIRDLKVSGGEILPYEEGGEQYLRVIGKEPLEKIVITYTLTTGKMFPRWERIRELRPYNTTRPDYMRYTKRVDGRINADHPLIREAAERLRKESRDTLSYVRNAMIWEQKTLKWMNAQGSIDEIFARGGGECSSLSTVLLSLLRNNGIPARPLFGYVIRTDAGESHVWSEFYLEGYGWLPIDPAFYGGTERDPLYIGWHDGRRLILTRGNEYTIHDGTEAYHAGSFLIAKRYRYDGGKITGSYDYRSDVTCTVVDDGTAAEQAYFNSRDFVMGVQKTSLAGINELRNNKGLPSFEFSSVLNDIAGQYLSSPAGADPLKQSGMVYSLWGRWSSHFSYPTLAPAEKFLPQFPWKELERTEFNRLGIGYRYVEGIHRFFFILLKTKGDTGEQSSRHPLVFP